MYEEFTQNMIVINTLTTNLQNLTAEELLELALELNRFSTRVKHIYVNAALSGRLTEMPPETNKED